MDIRLLYFDDCPNWRVLHERLADAARLTGIDITVSLTEVSRHDEAERLGFPGSPTVLIKGSDPFADESPAVGLSCRLYPTPAGTGGSPTVEQLTRVLTAALTAA